MTEKPEHIDVTRLGDRLYMIDAHMEGVSQRLSCYLYDTPEPLLIDAGPSNSFEHLVGVLEHLGVDNLATVLVTHVHIDHAGGAGHFAARFPRTRIAVHHVGARHLTDPSRLWNSAVRIYGEQELTDQWGGMLPIASDRIDSLFEGDTVSIGTSQPLQILDTPGHAKHHVTIFDPDSGGVYVGDTAGLCYPHGHPIQPNSPPPDFDPHLITGQLRRMAALDPSFVGFAHFGPRFDALHALAESEERVWDWVDFIEARRQLSVEDSTGELRRSTLDIYRSAGASETELEFLDGAAGLWEMHVNGVRRWLDLRDERQAAARG